MLTILVRLEMGPLLLNTPPVTWAVMEVPRHPSDSRSLSKKPFNLTKARAAGRCQELGNRQLWQGRRGLRGVLQSVLDVCGFLWS